ncbi:hypothetical protein UFOVP649_28 [uncultured Caudovirales phage]|uniref:Uncharacterized protein n=1 Tax=uncultured Caudovirales phage TaxID=2100421 RepID=A0A6J5N5I9_9CAUD|nr:hypothetical protein UFOVP649_28 [uncultured Caudovirales phage]
MAGKNDLLLIVAMLFAYCFPKELGENLPLFQTIQKASFFTIHGNSEFLKIVAQLTDEALYPIDVIFF